jgi:hypothetical protein
VRSIQFRTLLWQKPSSHFSSDALAIHQRSRKLIQGGEIAPEGGQLSEARPGLPFPGKKIVPRLQQLCYRGCSAGGFISGESIIQRAFGPVASGSFQTVAELEKALRREGFTQVSGHLCGPSLRMQLKKLMSKPAGRNSKT